MKRVSFAIAILADSLIVWKFLATLVNPVANGRMLTSGSALFFIGEMASIFAIALISEARKDKKLEFSEVVAACLMYGFFAYIFSQISGSSTVGLVAMASFIGKIFFAHSASDTTIIQTALLFTATVTIMLFTQFITTNIPLHSQPVYAQTGLRESQPILFWGVAHYSASIVLALRPNLWTRLTRRLH